MVGIGFETDDRQVVAVLRHTVDPVFRWLRDGHGVFDSYLRGALDDSSALRITICTRAGDLTDAIGDWIGNAAGVQPDSIAYHAVTEPVDHQPVRTRMSEGLLRWSAEAGDRTPLHCAVSLMSAVADLHPAGRAHGLISFKSHVEGLSNNLLSPDNRQRLDATARRWIDAEADWLGQTAEAAHSPWTIPLAWSFGHFQALGATPAPAASGAAVRSRFHTTYGELIDDYDEPWFRALRELLSFVYANLFPLIGIGLKLRLAAATILTEYSARTGWDPAAIFAKLDREATPPDLAHYAPTRYEGIDVSL
ncbi:hypothetical protein DFR76_103438 [Nocardia pseudobrasiliensis]|uniref:Uncharacterized protein n=1 Tax=Nocardia pseudobrasiliensis TaxID=45979 RepID=A0A370I9I0_9NOCA|nr:hypothetical protein DFR76_103438 [Nocardia pseudobrasiliensis]